MPIEYLPGVEDPPPEERDDSGRERAALREGMAVAARSTAVITLFAAAALVGGLWALRDAIVAAAELVRGGTNAFISVWSPAILFAIFGLLLGGTLGWRITSQSGLAGHPGWGVGMAGVLTVAAAGAVAALLLYPAPVPTVCWVCVATAVLSALPGLSYFAYWSQ